MNMNEKKIPKVIHYCWFGRNELPEIAIRCLESWKLFCPDYEIKLWNEDNYNIQKNSYMIEAYNAQKWAFVSDYARLDIVNTYGGIYLDIDCELIKSLDELLDYDAFFGFESKEYIATGLGFGSKKASQVLSSMLDQYLNVNFKIENGVYNTKTCPLYNTDALRGEGLVFNNTTQVINNVAYLSTEFLSPLDSETFELNITKNTISIHHFNAS